MREKEINELSIKVVNQFLPSALTDVLVKFSWLFVVRNDPILKRIHFALKIDLRSDERSVSNRLTM